MTETQETLERARRQVRDARTDAWNHRFDESRDAYEKELDRAYEDYWQARDDAERAGGSR